MVSCRTIAVFNHKGGVGKTTTAVNVAAALARVYGWRCLVVDLDPQANATRALLGRDLRAGERSVRDVLCQDSGTGAAMAEVLLDSSVPGLLVAPAVLGLSEAEFKLASRMSRELVLRECLRSVVSSFDHIVIDCPPSLGLLALNGLAAADSVLVPCETQFLSLRGLRYVLDVVALVRERLNPGLKVLGVLPTKFYVLSRANQEALACLRKLREVHVFGAVISRDVRAEEAPSHGVPLVAYAPDSRSAEEYLKLAEEVMQLCQNQDRD